MPADRVIGELQYPRLDTLLIGPVKPLGARRAPSGIDKHPLRGAVHLRREGFDGDAQGDRKHHGGAEKAVHHYARDHYGFWEATIGHHDVLRRAGAFGENFSTYGLTESRVAVGDTFRVGGAIVQVSQGRQPCWKLNLRFGVADMALLLQASGRTGWYYRVIEEGAVTMGDELVLLDRLSPAWTIERLWRALYVDTLNVEELSGMAALDHLPDTWRAHAARRLATRRVEDWTRRLTGDPAA